MFTPTPTSSRPLSPPKVLPWLKPTSAKKTLSWESGWTPPASFSAPPSSMTPSAAMPSAAAPSPRTSTSMFVPLLPFTCPWTTRCWRWTGSRWRWETVSWCGRNPTPWTMAFMWWRIRRGSGPRTPTPMATWSREATSMWSRAKTMALPPSSWSPPTPCRLALPAWTGNCSFPPAPPTRNWSRTGWPTRSMRTPTSSNS